MGEYKVERLIPPDTRISGKILVTASGIVFEPKHKNEEKLEIAVDKIRDVRFATEKEISAFRIVFEGVINAVLNPRIHKLLLIDFEDKFGIIQHLTFEGGDEIVNAERGLYAMRKAEKLKGE
jgi:hypothetical protein